VIFCPNCKAPNPDSLKFCGRCGSPLREEAPAEEHKAEQVPSWLRELGGGLEAGLEAGPAPVLQPGAEAPLPGGLPPWLAAETPAQPAPAAPAEAGLPPWLAEEAPAKAAPEAAPAEGLPPWLAGEAPAKAAPEAAPAEGLPPWLAEEAPPEAAPEAAPAEGLPPWLAEEAPPKAAPEAAPAEGLPPWLAEEAPAEAAPEAAPAEGLPPWLAEEAPPKAAPEAVPAEEGLPPWLAEEAPPKAAPEAVPAEEGLPPWLVEEAPAEAVPQAPPAAELPAAVAPVEEAPPEAAPEAAPAEGLPPWLAEEAPAEAAPEAAPAEGLPPWLAEEAPAKAAPEAAPAEGLPPWLAEEAPAEVAPEAVPAEVVPQAPPAAELPAAMAPVEEVPAEVAAPEIREMPSWLGGIEESLPSWLSAEEPAGVPAEEAALPSWLTGEEPAVVAPIEAPPAEVAPKEEAPSWRAEEAPAAAPAEAGLPSWLEAEVPAEAPPAEVAPKEEAPSWRAEEAPAAAPAEAGLPSWLEAEVPAEAPPAEVAPREEAPPWLVEEVPPAAVPEEAAPAVLPEEFLGEEAPVGPTAVPVLWSQLGEVPPTPPAADEAHAIPVAPEEEEALPEWAKALRPVEEEAPPLRAERESFLAGVELPEWLRVEEKPAAAEKPTGEPVGAMGWLDRLVKEEAPEEAPSLAAIERLPRPALPALSPARERAAEVFASLLASPEPVVQPKPQLPLTVLQRVLRWLGHRWPMLALALLMIVMVTVNLPLPEAQLPDTPGVSAAFEAINTKAAREPGQAPAIVLVAYDWDVQRTAEMRPLALALTAHLMKLKAQIIAVSTTFQGNQLAQEVKDEALQELKKDPDFVDDGRYAAANYGAAFLNLSMRTGGESALRLLGSQPISQTFPADFVYGRASREYPLVQQVRSLDDVALLVVMAGEEDRVVAWMEQVCARPPARSCVLAVPTELSPLVEPYEKARDISPAGVLWGLPTVVEYEARLEVFQGISVNREVSLQQRLHLLTVAEIGLVVLIALGNLAQIVAWLNGLRKGSSRT
jgi:hypothetical protein